jgi:NitT/TauT family transport system permease protein
LIPWRGLGVDSFVPEGERFPLHKSGVKINMRTKTGEFSKITMVIYSCAWPLLLNTIAGVKQVDPLLIKSARTMGATPQQLFRKVILPAALPTIFVGIRLASASAMLVLVASEMVGAKAGLGYLIIYSQYSFLIPQMYFGILGITVTGLAFNAVLEALERRLMRWKAAV